MILGLPSVVQLVVHLANLCFSLETLHDRYSVDASWTNNYAQMYKVGMASLSDTQNNYWDISLFPTTCISFSTFVPPSPSLSLPSFLSVSLFSLLFWFFFCFPFMYCPSLFFLLPSFLPFFLFLFCFLIFLLHAFLSSSFCSFAYNLLINPQYPNRHAVMVHKEGLSSFLDGLFAIVTGLADIFIALCVCSMVTQGARY